MQSKMYQFEIDRGVVNAVFDATDSTDGSRVRLYEWTPAAADRAAAKERLLGIAEHLTCEVFTADASLYLVAKSPEATKAALEILQANDLFLGLWANEQWSMVPFARQLLKENEPKPQPKEVTQPVIVPPPIVTTSTKTTEPKKKTSGCGGCLIAFLIFIAVVIILGIIAANSH